MVPSGRLHEWRSKSFPRASGDGPLCQHGLPSVAMFPPRERGWSVGALAEVAHEAVSPARAGMVPFVWSNTERHQCFPRASGDGPCKALPTSMSIGFPPRERGWSLGLYQYTSPTRVSPARAGMVPRRSGSCSAARSFPRASGDGPRRESGRSPGRPFPPRERGWSPPGQQRRKHWLGQSQFPPRERGWSPSGTLHVHAERVSPARAGMVPRKQQVAGCCPGFPRASGDGPKAERDEAHPSTFPPRERGWSQFEAELLQQGYVSPARAGMVPAMSLEQSRYTSFPRASGDGPQNSLAVNSAISFPPRERGWSLGTEFTRKDVWVSPARAGMVPASGVTSLLLRRFPRASGDGPRDVERAWRRGAFPPRERGWSRGVAHSSSAGIVSPARAGMVPHLRRSSGRMAGFPRASGDGPRPARLRRRNALFPPRERGWSPYCGDDEDAAEVSPARAGMVPCRPACPVQPARFPRASGDGPNPEDVNTRMEEFPPRERGWSLACAVDALAEMVSPARAGMVPQTPRFRSAGCGFPRASGDGPLMVRLHKAAAVFPPRERGWSQAGRSGRFHLRVSPARAGMVLR